MRRCASLLFNQPHISSMLEEKHLSVFPSVDPSIYHFFSLSPGPCHPFSVPLCRLSNSLSLPLSLCQPLFAPHPHTLCTAKQCTSQTTQLKYLFTFYTLLSCKLHIVAFSSNSKRKRGLNEQLEVQETNVFTVK